MHDAIHSTAQARSESDGIAPTGSPPDALRHPIADALQFWEPRRLVYNAWLTLIVATVFAFKWTTFREHASVDLFLGLFMLAVLANLVYCAAYPADVFVQRSGLRDWRDRVRTVLFGVGLAFAGVLAQFIARGIAEGG